MTRFRVTPFSFAGQILSESATMGFVGGVLGACVGKLVVAGVAAYQSWALVVDPAGPLEAWRAGT